MGRLRTIARRTFLIGSTAVAGGVLFGVYAYRKPHPNPLLDSAAEGEAVLTPYVHIGPEGVTIITPRADLGQGAYSVLAALVAEELDVAWEDINVDHGPPSPAYFNGAVAAEGMPFAATDKGFMARNARSFGTVVSKFVGLQITGGSSTVADAFDKMREAGAAARGALIAAAAEQENLDAADLETGDGHVVLPDGRTLSYVSLAPLAAKMDIPDDVALKNESEWRYLGQDMMRLDMVGKCTGTITFGIDVQLPDMVYATVKTNPRRGGPVLSYDDSAARAAHGVMKVVPVNGGAGVIATNTWAAMQAADLIVFDWGPAPYPTSSEAMWEQVEKSLIPARQDSQFRDDGNTTDAMRGERPFEATYRVPFLAHAALEPLSATVLLKNGKLEIWAGSQIPLFVLTSASALTGIPEEDITLHVTYSGGSFGRRLEDDFILQAIEVAMAMEGTPVKMTWSREEDMTHDFPRPMGVARGRGMVADGQVETLELGIAYPSVSESQMGRLNQSLPGADIAIVAGAWDQPYAIPNYRVTGYRVPAMVPVSSWRSVGASGNGFMHECFLDELIHLAEADPLEERLRLINDDHSRAVLEAVAEMSNWGTDPGPDRGRGVAMTMSFGVPAAEVVEVTNTPDGIRIDAVHVAVEVGKIIDPVNFEAQVSGGVIWGLGHAMNCEITYLDGQPQQTNFHDFEAMRLYQTPEIFVRGLENSDTVRGIGEPAVPPAAPALANAIFVATRRRIRTLPLRNSIDFV